MNERLKLYTFDNKFDYLYAQGLGASEKKKKKKNYIILQGGELTCSHFFKSSC